MRLLLLCLLAITVSFLSGAWIMTRANPEATFWSTLRDHRDAELQQKRTRNPGKNTIIFTGGSSCAFGIIPEIIEQETGWNCMNYGGAAGTGSKFLIEQALRRCQPGDILVLALETHFLTEEGRGKPTQLGTALAIADNDPQLAIGGATFGDNIPTTSIIDNLRPGARFTATWVGKALRGDLSYRYKTPDFRPGGWLETSYRDGEIEAAGPASRLTLTTEAKALLNSVKSTASPRNIRLFYCLPWRLTSPQFSDEHRQTYQDFLQQIHTIIPVIEDPALGVADDRNLFSDTPLHLSNAGAIKRSSRLAISLAGQISNENSRLDH